MALTFGKINRAASFNPQTAFPLDARSYFESYELALEAARIAEAAGSTNTVYYYGQVITVVENNVAKQYQIQPDNTLLEVGTGSSNNEQVEEIQSSIEEISSQVENLQNTLNDKAEASDIEALENSLSDKANASEVNEALKQKANIEDVNNALASKADSSDIEALEEEVANKADASALNDYAKSTDVYSKTEADLAISTALTDYVKSADVYSKEDADLAIASAVAAVDHLKREIVDNIDMYEVSPEQAEKNVIYMVKGAESGDMYKEYMRFDSADGTISFEQIGDTSVDMSAYAKTEEVNNQLSEYAKSSDLAIYAKTEEVNNQLSEYAKSSDLAIYAKTEDIQNQYATKDEVSSGNNDLADLINANQTAIGLKADASTVASLQEIVNSNKESIEANREDIDKNIEDIALINQSLGNKANAQDLTNLQDSFDRYVEVAQNKENEIRAILDNKASNSDLNDFKATVESELSGKVDIEEGSRLINAEEIKILSKLSFKEDGEVGFSGTVAAGSVTGLATFINDQLSSKGIENNAQANKIEKIYNADGNELAITGKAITLSYASDSIPGLIKLGSEFKLNETNALTVEQININKITQSEELLLDCGGAANRYASQV